MEEFQELVGQKVVLDTAQPLVYLGTLTRATPQGFWLAEADVHDCREGHASAEVYILNAATDGITPNRKRVFVFRSTVLSISLLSDVAADFSATEGENL